MKTEAFYRINTFISWREIDGQPVAVDTQEGKVYQFNEMAALIWKLLDARKTETEIIALVQELYEGPEKMIRKETVRFLKKLIQDDLIVKVSSP